MLEKDFVPSERYATLLFQEIPVGQRLEVFFSLYHEKEKWTCKDVPLFFSAMLSNLNDFELRQIYDAISNDFKQTDNLVIIDNLLRCLPFSIWSEIEESAALRIENKMIKSLAAGKINTNSLIIPDRLGIYVSKYYRSFRLKRELIHNIRLKLWSDEAATVSYLRSYILRSFSTAEPTIPASIDSLLTNRIKRDSKDSYRNLVIYSSWEKDVWSADLTSEVAAYEERHPSTGDWDDEIPF